MRRAAAALRAFLLDRLGLRGPLWSDAAAPAGALALGMLQIDSIRVTGLRNHELAWAARAASPPERLYRLLYGERALLETHYPLFAVRRDWVPTLSTAFADFRERHRAGRAELNGTMRWLKGYIRRHGPVTAAQFRAEQVPGGFNTVKRTTKALEYLFGDRVLQIAGRTPQFHRMFDLTERIAPEVLAAPPPPAEAYEAFLFRSALSVLKLATADQLAARIALHYGQWRGARRARWRALAERLLPALAWPVVAADLPDSPVYWYLPEDEIGWERAARPPGETLRLLPPLDNLLFSRQRLSQLFGLDYKFEAYTPQAERRFYFALPLLHEDRIVGLLDARRAAADGRIEWRIAGLDLRAPVPPESLRAGVHRIARLAGAEQVRLDARAGRAIRRALAGRTGP